MIEHRQRRRILVAASVLGVGLGGFFDGILLHQVLQWHHLLSLLPGETWRDISNQILADGLFHVLMYGVTALGLYLLWRARESLAHVGWRTVAGGGLLGFGLWNVVDVVGFHWLMGIHRIRVDVPDPLAYDLGWLAVFGVVPLAIAWALLRSAGRDSGGAARGAVTLSIAALIAAGWASLPPPETSTALVLFPAESGSAGAFQAAHAANAAVIWMNPEGTIAAVDVSQPSASAQLYKAGALLVTRSPALAGCVSALRA